ncbi:MAG: sulfotransferase family 2 domain-containing protein [Pseudomonadota bacterium]
MIVSHAHRFVFVHAPKTGGTSLATALERHLVDGDITIGDTPLAKDWRKRFRDRPKRDPRIWKHSTLAEIERWLGADALVGYRVVTLVRDPWDRLVSYYHWARAQDWDHPVTRAARTLDFNAFVAHPAGGPAMFAAPISAWVTGLDRTARCDLFVRLEDLSGDGGQEGETNPGGNGSRNGSQYGTQYGAQIGAQYGGGAAIGGLLGLDLGAIPHLNRSTARHHRSAYSPETSALVARLARRDIAEHGYGF